ncbi:MAG: PatB family C-S lyase [Bacteroidota bacterium]
MNNKFDFYPDTNRENFSRYNPFFQKLVFGRNDLLPFWVADTDFVVMPELSDALAKRANLGLFPYENKSPDLKKSLADWYNSKYDIQMNGKKLLFLPSVNTSIATIIDEFTDPGDGVIIQPPVYQAFAETIKDINREVVNNPLILKDDFYEIDFEDLQLKAQQESSKIMLLCSPHNPVGRVWKKDELQKIVQICIENDILMITDEIHGDIVFEPNLYIGMLNIYEGLSDNVIMVSSAGKTFGIPGLLDSFIYTPNTEYHKQIRTRIKAFHLDKGNAFSNVAWEVIYKHGDTWLKEMKSYLEGNIEYIHKFLKNHLPMIKMTPPEGTYQVWLDFRQLGLDNQELARFLSENAGIALNQGNTYGPGGDGFARMNIASPKTMISQAMNQLKEAVSGLK